MNITPEKAAETASRLFMQGYNCSQAIIGTFAAECGLDTETALKISSGFGGGMGRMREVCGSISGIFMAASMIFGYSSNETGKAKSELYARIQELAQSFKKKNGSIICRELLTGAVAKDTAPVPEARTPEYYKKRPCKDLIADAARIFAEYCAAQISDTQYSAQTTVEQKETQEL